MSGVKGSDSDRSRREVVGEACDRGIQTGVGTGLKGQW